MDQNRLLLMFKPIEIMLLTYSINTYAYTTAAIKTNLFFLTSYKHSTQVAMILNGLNFLTLHFKKVFRELSVVLFEIEIR